MWTNGGAVVHRAAVHRRTGAAAISPLPASLVLPLLLALLLALLVPAMPATHVGGGALFAQTAGAPVVEISWSPLEVPQGTLFEVRLWGLDPTVLGAEGSFAGQPLHFRPVAPGEFAALAAVPVDATEALPLEVAFAAPTVARSTIRRVVPVAPGAFELERLRVAPAFGDPQPPEIQRRIDEESARAGAVARASHGTPRMWDVPFVAPRESRITSGFGHGRIFNDQVTSRHTGTDFAGAVGEPVLAPARGVVALVDAFYLGGNVIYIDHGAGLVTGYLHLSAQEVRAGEVVEPGQVIGRVGATGRVTGPHLHWIVRYGTISVDGLSLLAIR